MSDCETHLNMMADDRSKWEVFSDDVVLQARLERIGAKLIRTTKDGGGKFYELHTDQVLLRKGKPQRAPLTQEQIEKLQRIGFRPGTNTPTVNEKTEEDD